jgi:protein-S-isoprenylcysteine O-methyltransferase Ste14
MEPFLPFRFAFLFLLLATMAVGAWYRIRAHTSERLDRRQEGLFILIFLRLAGFAFWTVMLWWIIQPAPFSRFHLELPVWLRWAGVAVFAMSIAWIRYVFRSLGRNLTDTVVTRKEATLITHGPYRWVRHPLYATLLPLGLAICLIQRSWLPAALIVPVFLALWLRTSKEEQNLLARFGKQYHDYMQRTGRFLPRLFA